MPHLYERKQRGAGRRPWVQAAVFLLSLALLAGAAYAFSRDDTDRQAELLEASVRRAAATCYAIEGRYPDSLQYLVDRYGVIVNTDRFVVRYSVFAENLMPEIAVIRMGGA